MDANYKTSTKTVLILFFCLIFLIVLLIILYKKLNRESQGEYTVRRMVYKEGGIRDQLRGVALTVGTRMGVQLWPSSHPDQDGEEMQDFQGDEGQVEEGDSQESSSESGKREEDDAATRAVENDTTNENSSSEDSSEGEPEAKGEVGQAGGKDEEKPGDGEAKGEASGGPGLLINLHELSGSAIWSGDEAGEGKGSNITAL